MSEINDIFHVNLQIFQLLRLRTVMEQARFIQELLEKSGSVIEPMLASV